MTNEHNAPALALALRFHETYERLAPSFGYETRTETRAFDQATPNGRLMVAVCGELLAALAALPERAPVSAVAFEMSYPKTMDAVSFIAAPEFVRTLERAEYIAENCLRLYGEAATYRPVVYATPAANKPAREGRP